MEPHNRLESMLSKQHEDLTDIKHRMKLMSDNYGKDRDRMGTFTLISSTIIMPLLVGAMLFCNIRSYNGHEDRLNDICEQIAAIKQEIEENKPPDDAFKEKLKELADKIEAIDAAWEGFQNDIRTDEAKEDVQETESASKERLPTGVDTNRFDCEPHTYGRGTDQYLLQLDCLTEEETGLRYFEQDGMRYYCVALGGAYGIDIGDTWIVTLECGTSFGIIFSDYQQDISELDPNDFGECYERDKYGNIVGILKNYDDEPVVHVLEFVVEMERLHPDILEAGTVSALDRFGGLYGDGGNLVSIKYNRRLWEYAA